ncbi:MAG TPA: SulP family inorganic anion transporter [Planococcus sp. (in: firmicutes)]|nr:SulP family inorganic anion transporter [Planococcus sp. (in: firmicutes)]
MLKKFFLSDNFKGYNMAAFQKDLLAGVVVGVIAIPLGMAFAIASGVKPEYGIYTTIIAGIIISLFGGSKFQIGGPTGAFIPILFGIVMVYGYENLLIAGFLAGIFLLLMGVFKLGTLIKFIPKSVTIGFTSGIAIIIFVGQIANFLGLTGVEKKESFFENIIEIAHHIDTINIYSVIIAGISLVTVLLTPKFFSKIPGPLIALVLSTVVATVFFAEQVPTIGSAFGAIPSTLPQFGIPNITFDNVMLMIKPALIIALLGGIESLLSAVVADGMTGTKHNSNKELMGQGLANMVTPLFGGIPATGAIARTATNIKNGAVSPLSGVIHSLVVLLILLLFAPFASSIPLASMAPILMVVAWNMSERHVFMHVLKTKTGDSLILLITFLLTIFVDLTAAVEVGIILAIVLFTKRMSENLVTDKVLPNLESKNKKVESGVVNVGHDCPQIAIYNIEGPLFFGAAMAFEHSIMSTINYKPKVLLLRMGKVPFIDITGEASLASIVKDFNKHGVVLLSGLSHQTKEMLQKTGLYESVGEENIFEHTGEAINYAQEHLDRNKCLGCKHFAFSECTKLSQSPESEPAVEKIGSTT